MTVSTYYLPLSKLNHMRLIQHRTLMRACYGPTYMLCKIIYNNIDYFKLMYKLKRRVLARLDDNRERNL